MNKPLIRTRVHHVAIQTACFEKAFHFYTKLLGLQVVKPPFSFKGERILTWLDAGAIMIELYSVKNDKDPQPYDARKVGTDHIAFEVEDIHLVVAQLSKYDVKILRQPFLPPTDDSNQPYVAFIEGPDGEEIELREQQSL